MTVTFVSPLPQERASALLEPELEIINRLIRVTAEVGLQSDPVSVVNLYVALKSKPLAILTGMAQSGKVALVRILAQALIGDDPLRCQIMTGHAWWAGQTGNVALFADMQTRLNSDKVLNLIEEAGRPDHAQRVYLACLTHISPAELTGFFAEFAYQLQHERIMRLPSIHLTEPIVCPSNLLLIGTMDTERVECRDVALLNKTTLIRWSAVASEFSVDRPTPVTPRAYDGEFLSSCIRDESSARLKLLRILGNTSSLRPMFQMADLLDRHAAPLPETVMGETAVYLANAWSKQGVGLFDRANSHNAAIAADLAIAQTILPHISPLLRSRPTLYDPVKQVLKSFPRSLTILENLS